MLDRTQYLKQFVEETREYLENLTRVLLQWERHPEAEDMVEEVFRIAHTIKGMAATMELREITSLSHQLENLLDQVRKDTIKVSGSFFDLLLASVDTLETLVHGVEEGNSQGNARVAPLLSQIEAFLAGEGADCSTGEEWAWDTELNEYEGRVIHRAREEGFEIFQVDIWLQPDCLLKRARVYVVLKNLEQLGEIIKTVPNVEDLEEERFDDHFSIVLVCKSGEEGISEIMKGSAEIVHYKVTPLRLPQAAKTVGPSATVADDEHPPADRVHDNRRISSRQTVRVGIDRLDQLMNLVGELVITKTRLEQIAAYQSGTDMEEALKGLGRISSNLQDVVMQARMVPVAQVFNRFPRMIRDLSRELGKKIRLEISGEDTELDRRVIDELADPLVHIIRNAIDHGLEDTETRIAAGKSPEGHLYLNACYEGNSVVIEIRDDGRGISVTKLKQKALERGIISFAEAQEMAEEEALDLMFTSGFSTASQVSNVSGRGVGLDAVRAKIESLNGSIEVRTQVDIGTSFRIKIPLTLAIIQALLIKVGPEIYALPLERVEEIRHTGDVAVKSIQGKEVISIRGEVLPLLYLNSLLQVPGQVEARGGYFSVIVNTGQQRVALVVDGLLGQQEIVIKPLGQLLTGIPALAGATILGDGKVALILDTAYFLTEGSVGREAL